MRAFPFLAGVLLGVGFVSFAPAANATTLYCTNALTYTGCPGLVCIDENHDGRFDQIECWRYECPPTPPGEYCPCGFGAMCPPPPN